jgi:peptidoglycan/xylan/chitin deacetylase (PgdA/CDA1 family)
MLAKSVAALAMRPGRVQNSGDSTGPNLVPAARRFANMATKGLTATLLLLTGFCAGAARAEPCAPNALGVARAIAVGGAPRLGLKTYPQTLDLHDHEVVLTFDDGPWPTTTPHVLAALAAECAKATFFLIGRNAAARPDLVGREIAEGHTVGSHSFSHPSSIRQMPLDAALADIDRGATAVDKAAGGKATKFFRFPGFVDSPALLEALEKKNMPVLGVDLWASDWNVMTPKAELELLMGRLRRAGRGMILLHDTKKETADMLPALLAALKAEHFHLVHLIAGDAPPPLRPAPAGWTSETEAINRGLGLYGQLKRKKSP